MWFPRYRPDFVELGVDFRACETCWRAVNYHSNFELSRTSKAFGLGLLEVHRCFQVASASKVGEEYRGYLPGSETRDLIGVLQSSAGESARGEHECSGGASGGSRSSMLNARKDEFIF